MPVLKLKKTITHHEKFNFLLLFYLKSLGRDASSWACLMSSSVLSLKTGTPIPLLEAVINSNIHATSPTNT
jgi:hypothetical protein